MSFQKVLIAIDEDPVAAHAAEAGMELARSLHAQVALTYVIDPTLVLGPDTGIAADDLPRIFNRFFTTRRDRNGTGLGLSLTRAVVEAHGGHVDVQSSPGQGATFKLTLPRAELDAPAHPSQLTG